MPRNVPNAIGDPAQLKIIQKVGQLEQELHDTFEVNRKRQQALDHINGSLSKINVKKIYDLDDRPATYATDATRTEKPNSSRPFKLQHDSDGNNYRVYDVGEYMQASGEFLIEIGRGEYGVLGVTKPNKEQPSMVKKVFSPLHKGLSAHEYNHLIKFKYCQYIVTVVAESLTYWTLGPMRFECFAMKYDPDFVSLEAQRKALRGRQFSDPKTTEFYTVALADIAVGLSYMHTANLIHLDLKVTLVKLY